MDLPARSFDLARPVVAPPLAMAPNGRMATNFIMCSGTIMIYSIQPMSQSELTALASLDAGVASCTASLTRFAELGVLNGAPEKIDQDEWWRQRRFFFILLDKTIAKASPRIDALLFH